MEIENIKCQRYDQGFEITIQTFERPRQWCDLKKKTKIVYDVYVMRWIITTVLWKAIKALQIWNLIHINKSS